MSDYKNRNKTPNNEHLVHLSITGAIVGAIFVVGFIVSAAAGIWMISMPNEAFQSQYL